MRRAYEVGLVHGRLGHRPANGYRLPWKRRAYARGYTDGRTHYSELSAWWLRRIERMAA